MTEGREQIIEGGMGETSEQSEHAEAGPMKDWNTELKKHPKRRKQRQWELDRERRVRGRAKEPPKQREQRLTRRKEHHRNRKVFNYC